MRQCSFLLNNSIIATNKNLPKIDTSYSKYIFTIIIVLGHSDACINNLSFFRNRSLLHGKSINRSNISCGINMLGTVYERVQKNF